MTYGVRWATVVVAVLLAGGAGACGGGSGDDGGASATTAATVTEADHTSGDGDVDESTSTTTSGAKVDVPDPCTIVAKDDVVSSTGVAVNDGSAQSQQDGKACVFQAADGRASGVTVSFSSGPLADFGYQSLSGRKDAKKVDGLGDGAYASVQTLIAKDGDVYVQVSNISGSDLQTNPGYRSLAEKLLAAL